MQADRVHPSLDDSWRFSSGEHQGPCITTLLRVEHGTPDALEVGMRVTIDPRAIHLYDPSGGGEWYLEALGKRNVDGAPIARLREKVTEVYVWAPVHWIEPYRAELAGEAEL